MVHEIRIPRADANEDLLLVADVMVEVGDRVEEGQELYCLETAKVVLEVPAEQAGFVRAVFIEPGDQYKVGFLAMLISDQADEPLPEGGAEKAEAGAAGPDAPRRMTAKQRLLARKRSEAAAHRTPAVAEPAPELKPSSELAWVQAARAELDNLETDDGWLTLQAGDLDTGGGDIHGPGRWVAGDAVIGRGTVIKYKRLYIAPGASIGAGCYIEATDLYIGGCAKVGDDTNLVSGEIIVSDGVYVGEKVEVDLSGGRTADSRLLVGPASLISPRSWLNTSREVLMEEHSAVSPGGMVFTHSFWQSVLEGYQARFAPVRLCADSWLGANAQVLPGVCLGPGCIVMSNSTVVSDVPANTMVGGVPASVVKERVARPLPPAKQHRILLGVLDRFMDHLAFKQCQVAGDLADDGLVRVTPPDGEAQDLHVLSPDEAAGARDMAAGSVVITWGQEIDGAPDCAIFDLKAKLFSGPAGRLTHELRNYLRRHGIRFAPHAWDASYRHGL